MTGITWRVVWRWAFRAAVFLTVALAIYAFAVVVRTGKDAHTAREIIEGQSVTQERSDCSRRLSDEQRRQERKLAVLNGFGLAAVARGDESGLAAYALALEKQSERVRDLRPLQELVDKKCPSVNEGDSP